MMESKVSLSITLPGRVMLSQEVADTLEKQHQCGYTKHSMMVEWYDKHHKKHKDLISFKTRNCETATQSINMCNDAYYAMIDKTNCPGWCNKKKWSNMSKRQRLEAHLQRITESLGGTSFTYEVFED